MISAGAKYIKLIKRCALRPLRSEEDLDMALEVAEELFLRVSTLDNEEADYLQVLGELIEKYEDAHHALPEDSHLSPADLLQWLMEVNGMKQVDLAKVLGVTSGRASEIANGVRDLSKAQILMLADHFCVRADLFLAKKFKASSQAKRRAAGNVKYTSKMAKSVASTRGVKESSKVKLAKPKKAVKQTRMPKDK